MVDVLLDTGSECSLLKESITREQGIPIKPPKDIPSLQGVTGKQLKESSEWHELA